MCAERTRVGLLGGTFDPVHLGHLASAREVATALRLDKVLLVLSARPPHKDPEAPAPAEARWRMLALAAAEDAARHAGAGPRLEPCDVELQRDGPSWTVETLEELARRDPGCDLFLIVGCDAWDDVDTWHRPGDLLALASVVVTSRPGRNDAQTPPRLPVAARDSARYDPVIGAWIHTSGHTLTAHRIGGIEVSATDIRRRAREGLALEPLTGESVARYITDHRLYGSGSDRRQGPAHAAEADGARKH